MENVLVSPAGWQVYTNTNYRRNKGIVADIRLKALPFTAGYFPACVAGFYCEPEPCLLNILHRISAMCCRSLSLRRSFLFKFPSVRIVFYSSLWSPFQLWLPPRRNSYNLDGEKKKKKIINAELCFVNCNGENCFLMDTWCILDTALISWVSR